MREPDSSVDLSSYVATTTANGGAGIIKSLARQGRRLTGPRQVIVNFVAPRRDHFSAQEIWVELRATENGVGRATVFRTLELLAEVGVIDRVHAGDGSHRYAVCEARHHHHFVCLDCSAGARRADNHMKRRPVKRDTLSHLVPGGGPVMAICPGWRLFQALPRILATRPAEPVNRL